MTGKVSTKVIQISNIAPQATKDQLQSIFGPLGKVEDLRLCKCLPRFKPVHSLANTLLL